LESTAGTENRFEDDQTAQGASKTEKSLTYRKREHGTTSFEKDRRGGKQERRKKKSLTYGPTVKRRKKARCHHVRKEENKGDGDPA